MKIPPTTTATNSYQKTASVIMAATSLMGVRKIAKAGIAYPFGDSRSVQQAFPSAVPTKDADPFLMCDYFAGTERDGPSKEYPVDWHPHKGFSIATYLKKGVGRHADSLGNREQFATPGMQWMNTGSGVEHAEGGGTEKGEEFQGFQIWINVPSKHKLDDPEYGTVEPDLLPIVDVSDGVQCRVLAGNMFNQEGPFRTKQQVQMVDFEIAESGVEVEFDIGENLDTAMLYLYDGEGLDKVNDREEKVPSQSVIAFDASNTKHRGIKLRTAGKTSLMLFAGKKIKEPVAWHGPIVMNTQDEIYDTIRDLRSGKFPPVRVDWDYKSLAGKGN